ncbi:MAG: hypothetical protein OXC94_08080 [Chloroflexi bacterium]|nr:hypothetical protein [Chloroflexota bacterium]
MAGEAGDAAGSDGAAPFEVTRIFTGRDGETHFETVPVALVADAAARARSGLLGTEGIIFRRTPGDMDRGWHHPPRRQLVVSLAGTSEVTASDGEVRRFGPGTVLLAEDVEPGSPGHLTRGVGDGDRLTLFVPLAEGEAFPPRPPVRADD